MRGATDSDLAERPSVPGFAVLFFYPRSRWRFGRGPVDDWQLVTARSRYDSLGSMATLETNRIGGALGEFWAGGAGPSRQRIESRLLIAGVAVPFPVGNKQQLVLSSITGADESLARVIVEELISLLRDEVHFDVMLNSGTWQTLTRVLSAAGHHLDEAGYITWGGAQPTASATAASAATGRPTAQPASVVTREVASPNLNLLIASLRRLGSGALKPLVRRRQGRTGMRIDDEYDLQDAAEMLLRTLYSDVRPEEMTPSSGGASSRIDFHLREATTAVELKITRTGRGARAIKPEILVDINDYRTHPSVRVLIVAIYDVADEFENGPGFEFDFTGDHNGLAVHVLVVPWTGPRAPA
jgi:hypothetical protein